MADGYLKIGRCNMDFFFNNDGTPVNEKVYLFQINKIEDRLRLYAGYIDSLMSGDTHQIERMFVDLRADGFVDEDGFFIYDE